MTPVEKALRRLVKAQHRLIHVLPVDGSHDRVSARHWAVAAAEDALLKLEVERLPCSSGPKAHIE